MTAPAACYIRRFRDITLDDVPLVGGKTASLGELHRELTATLPGYLVPRLVREIAGAPAKTAVAEAMLDLHQRSGE